MGGMAGKTVQAGEKEVDSCDMVDDYGYCIYGLHGM